MAKRNAAEQFMEAFARVLPPSAVKRIRRLTARQRRELLDELETLLDIKKRTRRSARRSA